MNRKLHKASGWLAGLAVVTLAAGTLVAAQQPTTSFDLDGLGSGTVLADVYTSPYTASIGGGANTAVICDDFSDESYNPESWTAYVTSVSSIVNGTDQNTQDLQWLGSNGTITVDGQTLDQATGYEVAAVLATWIATAPAGSQYQQDLSYALWGLFYPTGTAQDPGAFTWLADAGSQYATDLSNAENYLNEAVSYTFNAANSAQVLADVNSATIYSYDASAGLPVGCGGNCPPPPQEFITVATPEASAPIILTADVIGLLALVTFLRKRATPLI